MLLTQTPVHMRCSAAPLETHKDAYSFLNSVSALQGVGVLFGLGLGLGFCLG